MEPQDVPSDAGVTPDRAAGSAAAAAVAASIPAAIAADAPSPPPARDAGPSPERHIWALAALLVPLLFTTMVAIGVVLMLKRQMAFFRPAPSGAVSTAPLPLATLAAPGRGEG
jgi:hypothetical protein